MVRFPEAPQVVATVERMNTRGGRTTVDVEVVGPNMTPDFTRELRARARALIAAGPMPTAVDTIGDVTMGELKRLTSGGNVTSRTRESTLTEKTTHTVVVNRS